MSGRFPTDIFCRMCEYLFVPELVRLCLVCSSWNLLVTEPENDEFVWRPRVERYLALLLHTQGLLQARPRPHKASAALGQAIAAATTGRGQTWRSTLQESVSLLSSTKELPLVLQPANRAPWEGLVELVEGNHHARDVSRFLAAHVSPRFVDQHSLDLRTKQQGATALRAARLANRADCVEVLASWFDVSRHNRRPGAGRGKSYF